MQLVAQLKGPRVTNVRYLLRVYDPWKDDFIDYVATLSDFLELGTLFIAFSSFAKLTIKASSAKRVAWLKRILTPEKIHRLAPSFERFANKGGALE